MAGKKKAGAMAKSAVARSTMAVGSTRSAPRITPTKAGGIRVQNEEFLAGVGGGNATSYLLGLGPGTAEYPWLRNLASLYSKYRVHKYEVSYVSTAGTLVDGSVAVAPFYDAEDALFWVNNYGYVELLASQGAVVGPVYGQTLGDSWGKGSMTVTIDTNLAHAARPWYVVQERTLGDIAQENQSNFAYIGWRLSGASVSGGVGNIMVRYDIEFLNPVYFSAVPNPLVNLAAADEEPPEWWPGSKRSWNNLRKGPTARPKPTLPKPEPDTSVGDSSVLQDRME